MRLKEKKKKMNYKLFSAFGFSKAYSYLVVKDISSKNIFYIKY